MLAADKQLMSIFSAALDYESEAERAAYLDRVCGRNAELRERVQALIRAHDGAGGFMESRSGDAPTPNPVDAPTITNVPTAKPTGVLVAGRYRLLEVIGEGGMGTVWLADQTEPVRRRVALKLIKPGMDSHEVVGRFEAERQALALMDHPGIAKVHDGGVTDEGRPYFVMELVRGIPVTDFCDRARLGVRERLALFIQICQAIQHAHQKGIIHRDLKPSNILVAEQEHGTTGVVKVIDFGVSKAIGLSLTDDPVHTRFMQMVGTPLYMSPEQAERRGLDIDTRGDIYSLGVLLYELLTGTTPFDKDRFKEVGYDEVRRIIREEEPPKPSARVSTLSATASTLSTDRGADRRRLSRLCRGDLDWIVMKSLEKDRNRRYETASAFAADVQRYLDDEPVVAGPPTAAYRVRKFIRRHRGKVVAASAFLLLLVAAVAGLTTALVAVDKERKRKDDALALLTEQQGETNKALSSKSRALDQFYFALQRLTFDLADSIGARQSPLSETEKAYLRKLVSFFEKLANEHADSTTAWMIEGDGHWLVAGIRDVLGETKEAEAAYRAALDARLRLLEDDPSPKFRRGVADCRVGLAMQLLSTERKAEAETNLREAIALLTPRGTEFDNDFHARWLLARSYDRLGIVLREMGRLPDAEAAYRDALTGGLKVDADVRRSGKGGPRGNPKFRHGIAEIHDHLGSLLLQTNRAREAEEAYRAAHDVYEELTADFPRERIFQRDLAGSDHNLANLLFATGRIPEAEAAYRRSIARQRKTAAEFPLVPSHSEYLALGLSGLGTLLNETGRAPQAEESARESLTIRNRLVRDFPENTHYGVDLVAAHFELANVLQNLRRPKDAEESYRESIRLATSLPETAHIRQLLSRNHNNLGNLLFDVPRPKEAEESYRKAMELQEKLVAEFPKLTDYAVDLAGTYCNLGNVFQFHGQPDKAPPWYAKAIATVEPVLTKDARLERARKFLRNAHWGRADVLGKLNRPREALPDWDRAFELSLPEPPLHLVTARAAGLARGGEPAKATKSMDEVLAKKPPPGVIYDAACVFALAAAAVTDDAALRERHEVRAVELLTQLQAQGFFKPPARVQHLKIDQDFVGIRNRDNYRKLVAELEQALPKEAPKKH